MSQRRGLPFLIAVSISFILGSAARSEPPAPDTVKPQALDQQPRTDRFGDPLPDGAVARMGSVRWRIDGPASLRYAPDGKTLLVVAKAAHSSLPNVLHSLDAANGRSLGRLEADLDHLLWHISPDGRLLAAIGRASTGKNSIVVREVSTGRTIFEFASELSYFGAIRFAPDSRRLATVEIALKEKDKITDDLPTVLRLWDVVARKEVGKFPGADGKDTFCPTECIFSPTGPTLAATGREAVKKRVERPMAAGQPDKHSVKEEVAWKPAVYLWDYDRQKVWRLAEQKELTGPFGPFVFSPDGKQLAGVAAKKVCLWDTMTGKQIHVLGDVEKDCEALIFSPDGKQLVVGEEANAKVWDTTTGQQLFAFDKQINVLVFSPDSRAIAVGMGYRTIRVLEFAFGQGAALLGGFLWLALVPGSKLSVGALWCGLGDRLRAGRQHPCRRRHDRTGAPLVADDREGNPTAGRQRYLILCPRRFPRWRADRHRIPGRRQSLGSADRQARAATASAARSATSRPMGNITPLSMRLSFRLHPRQSAAGGRLAGWSSDRLGRYHRQAALGDPGPRWHGLEPCFHGGRRQARLAQREANSLVGTRSQAGNCAFGLSRLVLKKPTQCHWHCRPTCGRQW